MKTDHFECIHCHQVINLDAPGTKHRNHCPLCLWSLHLDQDQPGDRQASCGGAMEPVGLSLKSEGGKKEGELMLVHRCTSCNAHSKNRLAGDDEPTVILQLFKTSLATTHPNLPDHIKLLDSHSEREIITQLFGRPYADQIMPR